MTPRFYPVKKAFSFAIIAVVSFITMFSTVSAPVALSADSPHYTCGDGWYPGTLESPWTAKIRHGGAGGFRAQLNTKKLFTGGTVPWPNGGTMTVVIQYESATGTVTMTVDGAEPAFEPLVMTDTVAGVNGRIVLTAKTSPEPEKVVSISNIWLCDTLVSEEGITAQGSAQGRAIKHLALEDINTDFTLTFDLSMTWGSNPSDEGPCLQIDFENAVSAPVCPDWDINQDGRCDVGDVAVIGLFWLETNTPGWTRADVNRDGRVDVGDIVTIGLHWMETW